MVDTQSKMDFTHPADFVFSPNGFVIDNVKVLQKAVYMGDTIGVSRSGTYKMTATVYMGSNTKLEFGINVFIEEVNELGTYSHVISNKGEVTRIHDEYIFISGLNIKVNGVDVRALNKA